MVLVQSALQTGPQADAATGATIASTSLEPRTVQFVDMAFSARTQASALEMIASRPASARFAYVVTPNVDHVVRLQRNRSDLWPAYRGAWMTLCDSRILAWLAGRVGFALPVVTGSDLTAEMFRQVITPADSVAVLGGRHEMIRKLADTHGLRNLRHYDPPMGFIHDPVEVARAVRFLVEARARYSFLAVGSPQQEIIAYRVARVACGTGTGFCVGASLDFLTGDQARAPVLLQRVALEWLYRLASNPRRLARRYLIEGPDIFPIMRDWRRDHAQQ